MGNHFRILRAICLGPRSLRGSIVQRVYHTIHWLNFHPPDNSTGFSGTNPMDCNLSPGLHYRLDNSISIDSTYPVGIDLSTG